MGPTKLALTKRQALRSGSSSPFARWIEELVRRGITVGCATNLFCPTNSITNEQMAVFLLVAKEGVGYQPPA